MSSSDDMLLAIAANTNRIANALEKQVRLQEQAMARAEDPARHVREMLAELETMPVIGHAFRQMRELEEKASAASRN